MLGKPVKIDPFSYDNIVNAVTTLYSDADIRTIREAGKDNKYIEVKLDFKSPLVKDDASKLYIDKDRQESISHFDPRIANFGAQLYYSQAPLPFGTFGGLWTKILYSLFGLSLHASLFMFYNKSISISVVRKLKHL